MTTIVFTAGLLASALLTAPPVFEVPVLHPGDITTFHLLTPGRFTVGVRTDSAERRGVYRSTVVYIKLPGLDCSDQMTYPDHRVVGRTFIRCRQWYAAL